MNNRIALLFACLICLANQIQSYPQGARLVAEINPGSAGSYPSNFTAFAGALYFGAYTQATGFELFKFDGANVTLAADINDTVDDLGFGVVEGNDSVPDWFTELNGSLYFSAYEPRRGAELWRFNGSTATRVSDIAKDANDTIKFLPNSSWPKELTVFNNALYFSATTQSNPPNYELWKFDGSTVGLAANIHPNAGTDYSSYPTELTVFDSGLYFTADDGSNGWELFRFDGTSPTLINVNPGEAASSSYPKYLTPYGTNLYFQAYTDATGFELWKVNGTTATLVSDLNPDAASSFPEELIVFKGSLYFSASDGITGAELRRFDGTDVTLAADINKGGDSYPDNLIVYGDMLVFAADDGVHGWELWKFDGTTATLIADLNTAGDSFPKNLTVNNGILYFSATTPDTGYEVFKFDGTNLSLAADVNVGPGDSFPRFLHSYNNNLYFSAADNGTSNWEFWVIDDGAAPNPSPEVSLTAPANGSSFLTGDAITVSATATDDRAVAKVEFYANDVLIGTATSAPYSINTTLPAGTYSLTAKATDDMSATATSAAVNITVTASNQAPEIVLTAPAANASFLTTDSISFSATASDDGSIAKVEFFANGTSLGTDSAAPYGVTASLPAGTHTVTATATDDSGLISTSAPVTITVALPNTSQPTISALEKNGANLSITASASEGTTLTLQGSTNLVDWTNLGNASAVGGTATFMQPIDGAFKFYRLATQ